MNFFTTILAIAAVATAAVPRDAHTDMDCHPGTYSCTPDAKGWRVCDVSGHWVYAGACPPKTSCHFNEKNQSPYCI